VLLALRHLQACQDLPVLLVHQDLQGHPVLLAPLVLRDPPALPVLPALRDPLVLLALLALRDPQAPDRRLRRDAGPCDSLRCYMDPFFEGTSRNRLCSRFRVSLLQVCSDEWWDSRANAAVRTGGAEATWPEDDAQWVSRSTLGFF
jgi:hypothetical protein